jgi:hypothetical protein
MAAGTYNMTLEQGVDQDLEFLWKDDTGTPINLTGYTARMQARASYEEAKAVLELSTASNTIVIDGAAGKLTLKFSAAVTSKVYTLKLVYDIELKDPSNKTLRFLKGKLTVSPEATR